MRAVLDTNIFVSGLLLPKSTPGKVVAAWRSGQFRLVLSEPLIEEIAAVLAYPKIRKRTRWDEGAIQQFLGILRFEAELVDISGVPAEVPRDAKDNKVLATLLASHADCLVTGDNDLLCLAESFPIVSATDFATRIF